MVKKIVELEAKQVELERKLPLAKEDVIAFHPHAALRYRPKVEQIQEALTKGDSAAHEAIQIVRELITRSASFRRPRASLSSSRSRGPWKRFSPRNGLRTLC